MLQVSSSYSTCVHQTVDREEHLAYNPQPLHSHHDKQTLDSLHTAVYTSLSNDFSRLTVENIKTESSDNQHFTDPDSFFNDIICDTPFEDDDFADNFEEGTPEYDNVNEDKIPIATALWPTTEGIHVKLEQSWILLRWDDLQAFFLNPENIKDLPEDDIVRQTATFLQEEERARRAVKPTG